MTALIAVHFVICLFLVLVILLQPGKSDGGVGFGAASGSSQSIFGSRGAGNFLTKTTTVAACLFLVTSFFLTRGRMKEFSSSVIKEEAPAQPAPETKNPPKEGNQDQKPAAPATEKPAQK
ncbi:preprotein translocase subunit SecG [bacterium]|nr:preprotein translocase subunit SecG [bacterium]NBX82480.1 preprotein translocase subunit SecG [bacterium]